MDLQLRCSLNRHKVVFLLLLSMFLLTACDEGRPEWGSAVIGIHCGGLSSLVSSGQPSIALELGEKATQTSGRVTIYKATVSDLRGEAGSSSGEGGFAVEFSVPEGTASCWTSGTDTIYVRSTVPVQNWRLRIASGQLVRIVARTDQGSVIAEAAFDPETDVSIVMEWESQQ